LRRALDLPGSAPGGFDEGAAERIGLLYAVMSRTRHVLGCGAIPKRDAAPVMWRLAIGALYSSSIEIDGPAAIHPGYRRPNPDSAPTQDAGSVGVGKPC